tara:strand:+ start:344 stop:868 length:525 start_codon:yes stop_codon:yes gene_type:complete
MKGKKEDIVDKALRMLPKPESFEGFESSNSVTANDNIRFFYDEEFGPRMESTVLDIYKSKRYNIPVPDLKKMCRDRGLPVGGKKKELIDRLHEHTEKVKQDKLEAKLREEAEERQVVDRHKGDALLKIKNNIERTKKLRLIQLKELVAKQEQFDATETELREMKATLKTLEKVL